MEINPTSDFDLNQIKKLAAICRKAGIASFKGFGIEFTLTDTPTPMKSRSGNKSAKNAQAKSSIFDPNVPADGWEALTDEEKLFWSAGIPVPADNPSDTNKSG